jgi:general secretion pathway protein D
MRMSAAVKNVFAIGLSGLLMVAQTPAPQVPAGQPPAAAQPRPGQPAATPAPAAQVPAAQVPAAQVPAAQVPATQAPQPASPAIGGLNLPDAPLLQVIDILARELKINYILDAKVKGGSVTINTYGEIRAADVRPILETILRMNGLAMVQVGNFFRIVQAADAPRLPISPQVNMNKFSDDEQLILNLVFLKYMTAPEMEGILKPFVGESAIIVPYLPANLLMIEDNSRNMKRTMEMIAIFDSDQFAGQRVQLFQTKNSRPSDLVKELETVFKAFALSEKASAVRFLPLDRINTLLAVAANPGVFKEVGAWVSKLDVPTVAPSGGVDNFVYKLKYGRAENIGNVISQLYGGRGNTTSGAYSTAGGRYQNSGFNPNSGGGGTFGGGGGTNLPFNGGLASQAAPLPASPLQGSFSAGITPQTGGTGATGTTPAAGATGTQPAGAPDLTGQFLGLNNGTSSFGGLPRIISNPFDNTLLVQATPQQWAQIQKLLDQLDVPPRQVLIDARIYEVDLTGAFEAGVSYYLQQKGDTSVATTRQLLGAATMAGINTTAGLLVGQSRQLLAVLQASDMTKRAHVVSAPSVIATDSIPASINVGQTVPTLSAQAVGNITNGGTSQFTQSITNQSTGVALNILARVNASGVVTMVIDQSVSAPVTNTTSGIDSPSFSQREVSTQVTVEDGDTIAIGGIILESNSESSQGVPGLHRIPYLGFLFGTKSYSKSRTELIIFLTPKVIYDTANIAEATEELRQKVKNLTKLIKDN